MNILRIMICNIKMNFRDKQGMALMILFPIILIIILGAEFSSEFNGDSSSYKNINVLYKTENNDKNSAFITFYNEGKKMGINFTEAKSIEEGKRSIKNSNYACFVVDREGEGKLELYKNDRNNSIEAGIVEIVITSIAQRYNLTYEIAKVNPMYVNKMNDTSKINFVNSIEFQGRKQPRAIDYYSITMITLIIMYASSVGAWSIKEDKLTKTGMRIMASPVKKYEIMLGKLFGITIITVFQILTVFLFSKYLLRTYWGSDVLTVLGIMMSEIIMVICLGIGIAFIIKDEHIMTSVLNIAIPLIVFFGGGYIPLEVINNKTINILSHFSPLKWTNIAIFNVIYSNDYSYMPAAIAINLSISAAFILIAALMFKKEGAIK
jgi:ABC-2 type transport system permease protein